MSADVFTPTRLSLIVAVSENRVIGVQNRLPWHLPEDLKRFKRITTGHPVIMGRKTFESIGKPLPNRENIVISRVPTYSAEGVQVAHSLEVAIAMAKKTRTNEIFVIGGAEIYRQALPLADRLYLTLIHQEIEGDAFFPDWRMFSWRERERESHPSVEGSSAAYTYLTLDRVADIH